jgi:Tfp pilus assembly major pilin PilA
MQTVKQKGFAFIELLLIVAVVAVIGLVGYKIYNDRSKTVTSESPTSSTSNKEPASATVSPAPAVQTSADLDKASQTLDQNDPATANSADSAQLDKDSADF